MKIYLAGPVSNVGNFNFPLFDFVAQKLRAEGHEVFSPADLSRTQLGPLEEIQKMGKDELKLSRRKLLAEELSWICLSADAVALLPGWQQSSGAQAEYALAIALDLEVSEVPNVALPTEEE